MDPPGDHRESEAPPKEATVTEAELRQRKSQKQWTTVEERNSWVNGLRKEMCVRKDHFPETAEMIQPDGTLNREYPLSCFLLSNDGQSGNSDWRAKMPVDSN